MPGVVELIGALIGSKVSGGGGGGSTSAPASALAANTAANQLNPAQLASAIRATSGNVQTNTSGSVAPDYLSQLIQTQYGSSAVTPASSVNRAPNNGEAAQVSAHPAARIRYHLEMLQQEAWETRA